MSRSVPYFVINPEAFKSYVCCHMHLRFFSDAIVAPHSLPTSPPPPSLPGIYALLFLKRYSSLSMYL